MEENLKKNELESPDAFIVNKSLDMLMSSELVSSQGLTIKKNCKICSSELREETEQLFESGSSYTKISEHLRQKGLDARPGVVRHHIMEHFKNMERTMILMDYCENLASMMSRRHDKLDDVELLVNVARAELARAISIPTNGDISKEKIRSDIISKAMSAMSEHIRLFGEMEDSESKTKAMYTKFISVWKYQIENSKSEEEKNIYRNTLKQFQHSLAGANQQESTP